MASKLSLTQGSTLKGQDQFLTSFLSIGLLTALAIRTQLQTRQKMFEGHTGRHLIGMLPPGPPE